jgi:hypothetical protein
MRARPRSAASTIGGGFGGEPRHGAGRLAGVMAASGRQTDEAWALAERLMKPVRALSTQKLRQSYLRTEISAMGAHTRVRVLDYICMRAQGASPDARDTLVAVTAMLREPEAQALVAALRVSLEPHSDSALRRVLWAPDSDSAAELSEEERDRTSRVPDYGKGRPLTLGERKALARSPSRKQFDKLLLDPHPAVIQNLLNNPLTTEDDVVRMTARRPLAPEILREVAHHCRWTVRRRVRLAIVLNPYCPPDVGIPLVGLLLRSELRLAVEAAETHPEVRAAASERLSEMRSRRT